MNKFADLTQILRSSIREKSVPNGYFPQQLREVFTPKLHTDVPDGYCVDQGDAAISEKTLLTGGLSSCTAIVITSATHNFVCHVDSCSEPKWITECIQRFMEISGPIEDISRYNCHGAGLNESAEKTSRAALETLGLFKNCKDVPDGITMLHSVGAKEPGCVGSRQFAIFGKLKAA